MTREELLLQSVDRSGRGLEIGASYNPIAPKSDGWKVDVVDHLDADGLRAKYSAWGVDISKVEAVDYVLIDKGLFETIEKPAYYDFILASHVIEHVCDLVSFLKDCQTLLKPLGVLSLAVPDKRFCFDVFKPISTTGMALQAYIEKRKRHPAGMIFDNYANHAIRDGTIVWSDRSLQNTQLAHTIEQAKYKMDDYIRSGAYEDIHAWFFTPHSFCLILQDLNELGLSEMGITDFHETSGFEFFITLKKGQTKTQIERIRFWHLIEEELQREG
jgi:predicted SAM-dependent methyltransferase